MISVWALPFATALAATILLTPLMRRWAIRIGAVDHPAERKVHRHPMPRLGGLAVYAGFWMGLVVFGLTHPGELPGEISGVFMGTIVLVLLGLYDDLGDAPVSLKLPIQIVAAHLAYFFGVRFELAASVARAVGLDLPPMAAAAASYVLTILWLVGVTNAINFMDGLDGLAIGLSFSATVWLGLAAALTAVPSYPAILTALAGALLAFARFNVFPATIFLGDTGSTFLGFTLANLSVLVCQRAGAALGMRLIPLVVLAIPVSDVLYAIVRRVATGANVFLADRGHLHHRLLALGFEPQKAARLLVSASWLAGAASPMLLRAPPSEAAAILVALAAADVALAKRMELFGRSPGS